MQSIAIPMFLWSVEFIGGVGLVLFYRLELAKMHGLWFVLFYRLGGKEVHGVLDRLQKTPDDIKRLAGPVCATREHGEIASCEDSR